MSKYDYTSQDTYKGYTINTGKYKNFYCNTKTLDQIIDIMEYMISNHSKVLLCRIDIHLPTYKRENIRPIMTRIMEGSKRKLESKYRDKRNKFEMKYVWRAERNISENEHVHCLIFLNGNTIKSSWTVMETVNEVVKRLLGIDNDGLVHFCHINGGYDELINRNSNNLQQQLNAAIYAASYLAKSAYDCNRPKGARISSASRLPRSER